MGVFCHRAPKPAPRGAGIVLVLLTLILSACLCGCSSRFYVPPFRYSYENLAANYQRTQLGSSGTLDVLTWLREPEPRLGPNRIRMRLLSQSDTVVASSAQSRDRKKTWCTVVGFNETMTARAKYFFFMDEVATVAPNARALLVPPRGALMFDSVMVVDPQLLAKPYATDEAKQVAIFKQFGESLKVDVAHVADSKDQPGQGNQLLSVCAVSMNQVFQEILRQLDESPGLARDLAGANGVRFDDMSLDRGRVRLVVDGGIAVVRIRLGVPMD